MLTFKENCILQRLNGKEREWTIPQLLEICGPLAGEPLPVRSDAMKQVVPLAEQMYSDLSEKALWCYDFWKQLQLQRIPEQHYRYTTKISKTYDWELTLTSEGLFYKDITPEYSPAANTVYEQMLSDFWFCGPLFPIPDLDTRKWLVAHIRNAFLQAGSSASYRHFELFEYPAAHTGLYWESGDSDANDFVAVRAHGIETGRTNWRDGLVWITYTSFEHFLSQPANVAPQLTPEIRAAIEEHLFPARLQSQRGSQFGRDDRQSVSVPLHTKPEEIKTPVADNAISKQLFMDNGGFIHHIHRDGFGDVYHATPEEEAAWRKELLEHYAHRIKEEDNGIVLTHIARNMQYHGVNNVEELLLDAAKSATPKAKQAIAQALGEACSSEKGVEILFSLLELEKQDSYWRDYVFNSFFHMQGNKAARRFIIGCLQGDDEAHFKKAVDVLRMWGYFGLPALTNQELLKGLNWDDATAADPDFNQSLKKVIHILSQP